MAVRSPFPLHSVSRNIAELALFLLFVHNGSFGPPKASCTYQRCSAKIRYSNIVSISAPWLTPSMYHLGTVRVSVVDNTPPGIHCTS